MAYLPLWAEPTADGKGTQHQLGHLMSPILGTIYAIFQRLLNLGVLAVKQRAKTTQDMSYQFEKPAKQRILEAADHMFRLFGIHANLDVIAR